MLKFTTIATFAALLATPALAQQTPANTQSAPAVSAQQQAFSAPQPSAPAVNQIPANNGVAPISCGMLTPCHDGSQGG